MTFIREWTDPENSMHSGLDKRASSVLDQDNRSPAIATSTRSFHDVGVADSIVIARETKKAAIKPD